MEPDFSRNTLGQQISIGNKRLRAERFLAKRYTKRCKEHSIDRLCDVDNSVIPTSGPVFTSGSASHSLFSGLSFNQYKEEKWQSDDIQPASGGGAANTDLPTSGDKKYMARWIWARTTVGSSSPTPAAPASRSQPLFLGSSGLEKGWPRQADCLTRP